MRAIETFEEFWPFYLSKHRLFITKLFHIVGTLGAILWIIECLLSGRYILLPIAIAIGYGPATSSHLLFERNKPVSFYSLKFARWSFLADLKMVYSSLTGKL